MDLLELLGRVLGIVVIDLVLSGDNAVVIGMAARKLHGKQRRRVIVLGGAAAIVLRMTFTALAAVLLNIRLLMAVGGAILVWIAFNLLSPESEGVGEVEAAQGILDAMRIIILADLIMSLDNILAVGGVSHGHIGLLIFGLALSIPILMTGASLVALLVDRFPWLVWLGAIILAYTAGQMIIEDPIVHDLLEGIPHISKLFPFAVILFVVLISISRGNIPRLYSHKSQQHDEEDPSPGKTRADSHVSVKH
mgnify:FL=1